MATGVLKAKVGGSWVPISQASGDVFLNAANTFTGSPQKIDNASPRLMLWENDQAVDNRRFDMVMGGGALIFQAINDAGSSGTIALQLFRDGTSTLGGNTTVNGNLTALGLGTTPLNATNLTSGTVADARLSTNVALRNDTNNFSADQTVNKDVPALVLYNSTQAVDSRRFEIKNTGSTLVIRPTNDAVSQWFEGITMSRTGGVSAFFLSANTLVATGTGGNVACKDQANTFTANQTISTNSYPEFRIIDTSQPVDLRMFRFFNGAQSLYCQATNDAITASTQCWRADRNGNFVVNADIYEKARSTPMGHWIDFSPVFTNASVTAIYRCAYMLIGKTCFISFLITVNVTASVNYFGLTMPAGLTNINAYQSGVFVKLVSGGDFGVVRINHSENIIRFQRDPYATAWPGGQEQPEGMIFFQFA